MVGALDDRPRLAVTVDLPAPGERLVADAQVAPAPRARRARGAARPRAPRLAMTSGDVFEHTSINCAPSACITSNLRSARSRLRRNAASGDAFEIAERLVELAGEPEIGGHGAHVGRRAVVVDEIVLEQLEAVEARGGDGLELFPQRAAHRNGGDRSTHRCAFPVLRLVLDLRHGAQICRGSSSGSRRTRGTPESSRTACPFRRRPDIPFSSPRSGTACIPAS